MISTVRPYFLRALIGMRLLTTEMHPTYARQVMRKRVPLGDEHVKNCVVVPDRSAMLSRMPKNAVVAEIGVEAGHFSAEILRKTKPNQLWLIDCADRAIKRVRNHPILKPAIETGVVRVRQGVSWDELAKMEANTFDWIYIDADHTYKAVKKDLVAGSRVVKPDGLIALNDYVRTSYFGVVPAVNEFCHEYGWELIFLAVPPSILCDVVLRKIK